VFGFDIVVAVERETGVGGAGKDINKFWNIQKISHEEI